MKSLTNRRFWEAYRKLPEPVRPTRAKPIAFGLQILDCRRCTLRQWVKFGRSVSATQIIAPSQMSKSTQFIGSGLARMTNTSESSLVDSKANVDLTLLASIWSRLSFVCVGFSGTLERLHYEQHGLCAPVRRRPHRADDVPCVPYAASSRSNKS